jgi:replicative DNA helicase
MSSIPKYDEQVPPPGDDDFHRDAAATHESEPRKAQRRSRRAQPGKASREDAGSIPGLVTPAMVTEQHKELSKLPTVKSGFTALDALLDGLRPTQPYVLAAATGQGKTSFVLQLVTQYQGPVLIWTREMESWQLQGRMVAQLSGWDSNSILRGDMAESAYTGYVERFKRRLRYYHGTSLQDFERSIQHVATESRQKGFDAPLLVVIDYLQKLAGPTERLREAVSQASEVLRRVTQQHKLITWIVSAVGREAARRIRDQRASHPGELVDVGRESGSIEYDTAAILVLGLDPEDADGVQKAVVSVAKNRYGKLGQVEYRFEGASGQFIELGQLEPKAKRERRTLRDQIIAIVKQASGPMSKNAISEKATGRKANINREIDAMVRDGELAQVTGGYALGDEPGDRSGAES